jgi:hypothetical protein
MAPRSRFFVSAKSWFEARPTKQLDVSSVGFKFGKQSINQRWRHFPVSVQGIPITDRHRRDSDWREPWAPLGLNSEIR